MSEKEQQSQEATIECEVIEEDYVYKEEAYKEEETYEKEEETFSAVAAKNFFDLTYTKSIEGILRLISIPVAIIFLVLNAASYHNEAELINIFVAVGWISYSVIVIIVEIFVPGIFIHRLVDGILCLLFTGLWTIAVLIAIIYAARFNSIGLGISMLFGIAVATLVTINGFFALRTWRTYANGRGGSVALC